MEFFQIFLYILGIALLYFSYRFIGVFLKNLWQNRLQKMEPNSQNIDILKETFDQNGELKTKGIRMIVVQKENSKKITKNNLEETINASLHFLLLDEDFKQKYYYSIKNGLPLGIYKIFYKRVPDKAVNIWFDEYDPRFTSFVLNLEEGKGPTLQCKWVDTKMYVLFDKSIKSNSNIKIDVRNEEIPPIKL